MTKWYKKVFHTVGDALEDVGDAIQDVTQDVLDDAEGMWKAGKCYTTVATLTKNGSECYRLANETSALCETTQSRGQAMMDFGSDITRTLQGFTSTEMDVQQLETIKDLMDGDRLRSSMELAKDMDQVALECVTKSCRMIAIMEETLDEVPTPLQTIMNTVSGKDDAASELEQERTHQVLSTLEDDLDDGKACIDALHHLDIASALHLATLAFANLSQKATTSQQMFTTLQGFAQEVATHTQSLKDNDCDVQDMVTLASKLKDMWHCLTLSGLMRQLADAVAKIIRVMIDLFQSLSDRLCTLWAALAYAKDCMVDCVDHVIQAKALIGTAHSKSRDLLDHSQSISRQLDDLDDFNMNSITAIQSLSEGGEINAAIEIAASMDDLVLDCSKKVVAMVERVTDGVTNLPDIIISDIGGGKGSHSTGTNPADREETNRSRGTTFTIIPTDKDNEAMLLEEGKKDDDPEPEDMEERIAMLETSRQAVINGDMITATKASIDGFKGALDIESTCQMMLALVQGFCVDCNAVIDSFLGVWDLESAMDKISEMCRIVKLGDMMKQFANQIKRLLQAIIALFKAVVEKLSLKNLANIDLGDAVDDAVDAVKDKFDDVKDKLQFWKK